MIVGFNHNITYKGTSFHVQTEDSGIKKPQLVTLLYNGGTIISSQKTTYADIIKVDNLEQVVEELAKEQHKGMLRRLTKGEFDQRIVDLGISMDVVAGQPVPPPPVPKKEPAPVVLNTKPDPVEKLPVADVESEHVTIVEEPIIDKFNQRKVSNEPSLDEVIYSYLTAGQKS